MIKLSQIAAAAVLALSFGGAQASLVIDSFTAEQNRQIADYTTDGQAVYATPVADAGILGGFRDVYISKEGNPAADPKEGSENFAGITSSVFNGGLGGAWTYNEQSDQKGLGVVRWDGSNSSEQIAIGGLGGLNLAASGSSFKVDVLSADASLPLTFRVWTALTGTTLYTEFSKSIDAPSGAGSYIFNFSDFIGANFANVGALELQVNGGGVNDLDTQIDMVSVVPEPGTLALAGIALLGLGAIRRRKS